MKAIYIYLCGHEKPVNYLDGRCATDRALVKEIKLNGGYYKPGVVCSDCRHESNLALLKGYTPDTIKSRLLSLGESNRELFNRVVTALQEDEQRNYARQLSSGELERIVDDPEHPLYHIADEILEEREG